MTYGKHFSTRQTPQIKKLPGSTQVPNAGGGYGWKIDKWKQLDRFLILGSEGGSYYASEEKLTVDNANSVLECLKEDGLRVVETVKSVAKENRAYKLDPPLFVLALASSNRFTTPDVNKAALGAIPEVCRKWELLALFLKTVKEGSYRGTGRMLRNAIAAWYHSRKGRNLVYQMLKYANRDGFTQKDMIHLGHVKPTDPVEDFMFKYAFNGLNDSLKEHLLTLDEDTRKALEQVNGVEIAKSAKDEKTVVDAIKQFRLTREMIPTEWRGSNGVSKVLMEGMVNEGLLEALVRSLGPFTANEAIKPMSKEVDAVVGCLNDQEKIRKSGIHPMKILVALHQYSTGHGEKGSLSWNPNSKVVDALDRAFYLAFGNIVPSNKKIVLALDVSGSMTWPESRIKKCANMQAREASAAMALVTAATEPNHHIVAFSNGIQEIDISPRQRMDDVINKIGRLQASNTDCAAPMLWAMHNNILGIDAFVIYTDSETNSNSMHPAEAIKQYRQHREAPQSKLIVVAMTSGGFSIADPTDAGMLDLVGFDTSAPQVISEFISGKI